MAENHLFPFEKHHVLDSAKRKRHQPVGRLLSLVLAERPTTVIDLGAGTGYFAIPLAQQLPNGLVIAIDADPRMLDLVRKRASAARVASRLQTIAAVAGEHPLPLSNGIADVIFSVSLYHELPKPEAVLLELAHLLRPGGRLILSDWDPGGDPELGGPPPSHRVPVSRVVTALQETGYTGIADVSLYRGVWTLTAVAASGRERTPGPAA
ncbi:MAG: class I SAM-dependent methyltransferase [Acidobacteria bacterium]|nr:class I SAM-dependent methyltransferase [Acidobacteriota bacterium]